MVRQVIHLTQAGLTQVWQVGAPATATGICCVLCRVASGRAAIRTAVAGPDRRIERPTSRAGAKQQLPLGDGWAYSLRVPGAGDRPASPELEAIEPVGDTDPRGYPSHSPVTKPTSGEAAYRAAAPYSGLAAP